MFEDDGRECGMASAVAAGPTVAATVRCDEQFADDRTYPKPSRSISSDVGRRRTGPGRWQATRHPAWSPQGGHAVWSQATTATWWRGFSTTPSRRGSRARSTSRPRSSADGGYVAYVRTEVRTTGGRSSVADTEEGGEGLGAVDLPRGRDRAPPPRAIAVTHDGLVVAGGPDFSVALAATGRRVATVDLAETAPGQVVLGDHRRRDLVVNEGDLVGRTDATRGPSLPRGTTGRGRRHADRSWTRCRRTTCWWPTRSGSPTSRRGRWAARRQGRSSCRCSVATARTPGRSPRPRDGSSCATGVPLGVPGAAARRARLLGPVQTEGLARCRPDTKTCELVDVAD